MRADCILVVDPDVQARRVIRSLLNGHGFNVLEAGDGATAMAAFEHSGNRIAVLIVPVFLPETVYEIPFLEHEHHKSRRKQK